MLAARNPKAAKMLISEMKTSPILQRALFCKADIDDKGAEAIAKSLSTSRCSNLTALHIPHNRITAVGARHLATALVLHDGLTTLDLSHNLCGDAGCTLLAALLPACPSLRGLGLRSNRIGPAGAESLAAALDPARKAPLTASTSTQQRQQRELGPASWRLEGLDIGWNTIGDVGAAHLASALSLDPPLRELDVSGNGISLHGSRLLEAALWRNWRLRRLSVFAGAKSFEEWEALEAMNLKAKQTLASRMGT